VAGTVAGIAVLFATRNEFAFPVASFPLFYPLVYYLTHSSLRYRHALDPILVLLTAIASAALATKMAGVSTNQKKSSG
jgi:hypothetical protein